MGQRLQFQTLLEQILGSRHVYFQPPANVQMQYPCIVYERDEMGIEFAGNAPYRVEKRYKVTVIDRNPDSVIPDKIAKLPMVRFSTHFANDGLNHDVFAIYF